MTTINVNKSRMFVREKEKYASGASKVYPVQFIFGSEWDGLTITIVFRAGDTVISTILSEGDTCDIPWEVLEQPGKDLEVGAYGVKDGDVVLPTIWGSLGTVWEGAEPGDDAKEPNPDVYQQVLAELEKTVKTVNGKGPDKNGNVNVSGSGGGGEAGGYYIPSVTQPDKNTMEVSYTPSQDGMEAVADKKVTLPAGPKGDNGVGILSVEQTTASTEDGGINVITVSKTDGTESTFEVRNGGNGTGREWRIVNVITIGDEVESVDNIVITQDSAGNPFELEEVIVCAKVQTVDNASASFTLCASGTTTERANTYNYPILLSNVNEKIKSSTVYSGKYKTHLYKQTQDNWAVDYGTLDASVGYSSVVSKHLPICYPANVYYTYAVSDCDKIRQLKWFGTCASGTEITIYGR